MSDDDNVVDPFADSPDDAEVNEEGELSLDALGEKEEKKGPGVEDEEEFPGLEEEDEFEEEEGFDEEE